MANYYWLLQIEKTASDAEIRAAYRREARGVHPDLHPDMPDATQRLRELNEARDTLLHPERRHRHDRVLLQMELFAESLLNSELALNRVHRASTGADGSARIQPAGAKRSAPAGPEDDPGALPALEPTDASPREIRRWRRGLGRLERDYIRWSQDSRVASLPCLRQKYLYAVLHPRRYYGKEQLVSHWLGVDSGEIRKQCEQCDKWRSLYAAMKDEKGNRRGLFSFLSRAAGLIIGLS